jgi:hypothetical protein
VFQPRRTHMHAQQRAVKLTQAAPPVHTSVYMSGFIRCHTTRDLLQDMYYCSRTKGITAAGRNTTQLVQQSSESSSRFKMLKLALNRCGCRWQRAAQVSMHVSCKRGIAQALNTARLVGYFPRQVQRSARRREARRRRLRRAWGNLGTGEDVEPSGTVSASVAAAAQLRHHSAGFRKEMG